LLLTETRASLLAVLLSFLVIPFIAAWRKRGRTRKLAIAGAMVIIALGVGFYLARDTQFVSSIPGVRRIVTTSLLGGGNRTRLIAWDIALESWKDKWLFGWGPENFYAAFNYHYRPESLLYSYYETWFDRAHNSVLDMLSMTGVVGTLLALGVYAAAAWTVFLRVRRERLTAIQGALFLLFLGAYFFQNLFAFDALSGFLLFYLLIAFIDADPSAQAGSSEKSGKIPVLGLLAFGAPLIAFTAWLVLVNFNMWRANRENLEAISLARYGRFEEAAARHALAMSRNSPHAPEIRADFAREAAQLMGRVPKGKENAALALMQTAVNELRINVDEGKDVYDAIVLSQVLMATGNPQLLSEAEMILRDALPLSPKRQQLLYTLAKVLILEKRFDEAIALAQNIVADESRVGESHWVLALALSEAGKKEESWQAVIAALKNNYQLRDANDEGFVMSLGSKFGAPKEALPLLVYAELEAARGASSSAREHANRVLRLDPSLQERVETLLKKLGN
jgi:Flp pilus assembly protein TadD